MLGPRRDKLGDEGSVGAVSLPRSKSCFLPWSAESCTRFSEEGAVAVAPRTQFTQGHVVHPTVPLSALPWHCPPICGFQRFPVSIGWGRSQCGETRAGRCRVVISWLAASESLVSPLNWSFCKWAQSGEGLRTAGPCVLARVTETVSFYHSPGTYWVLKPCPEL